MKTLNLIFRALSSPKRLELFKRVQACCGDQCRCAGMDAEACLTDLAKGLGIGKATVSHHIKVLSDAGLVTVRKHGREVSCHVCEEALAEVRTLFGA